MEAETDQLSVEPAEGFMKRARFYYLKSDTRDKLDQVLTEYLNKESPNDFMGTMGKTLPVEKLNPGTLRVRVEGMHYLAERLWSIGLATGKQKYGEDFSRENFLQITKTMPMSHYHYLNGSREPMEVLLTRDDVLQDPSTAMVKLETDIRTRLAFIQDSSV
ncbi:hypothetical protein CEE37_14740 [candidate division LCP-89 bacterium B3_LCP]|uniref:Uncharacterized protein n=1 Tax=candidate division LCP-89 bacterium B3_LCP TaxID=2012998 RepID=A0A532UPH2_UNCL8|nr:MAG: hypothetical protein CEE37_14740 [candidate division LCP-89 bacterium B3_LCP]